MTWMGPTYAMWSDTVDEMNGVIEHANSTARSLEQWRAYAKKLEAALIDVAQKHRRAGEVIIGKSGAEAGQAILKEAALKELERLDPTNQLLDQNYRQAMYDKERRAVETEMRAKQPAKGNK